MSGTFNDLGAQAGRISAWLSWIVERICALLIVVLVLDVWLGVFARYIVPLPITFTEELARYLMIWAALLAVSCAISRREHIGVRLLVERFSPGVRNLVALAMDLFAFVFFGMLFFFGLGFVESGMRSFTMIFGMTKTLPFAAVPVSAALACIQLVLVAIRDQALARQAMREAGS